MAVVLIVSFVVFLNVDVLAAIVIVRLKLYLVPTQICQLTPLAFERRPSLSAPQTTFLGCLSIYSHDVIELNTTFDVGRLKQIAELLISPLHLSRRTEIFLEAVELSIA